MLLKHWPQKRREWVIGGFLNILFILCIVGTRYYYAQEEMEFLREDSARQDVMIDELQDSVEILTKQNNELLHDLHTHDKTRGIENYSRCDFPKKLKFLLGMVSGTNLAGRLREGKVGRRA